MKFSNQIIRDVLKHSKAYGTDHINYRQKAMLAAHLIDSSPDTDLNTCAKIADEIFKIHDSIKPKKPLSLRRADLSKYLRCTTYISIAHYDQTGIDAAMLYLLISLCDNSEALKTIWGNPGHHLATFANELNTLTSFKNVIVHEKTVKNSIDSAYQKLTYEGANSKANSTEAHIAELLYPTTPECEPFKIVGLIGSRCTGKSNLIGTFLNNRISIKKGKKLFHAASGSDGISIYFRSCLNKEFPEIVSDLAKFYSGKIPPRNPEVCLEIIERYCKEIPAFLILSQMQSHSEGHASVRMRQGGIRRLFEVLSEAHPFTRVIFTSENSISEYVGQAALMVSEVEMPAQTIEDIAYFITDLQYTHFVRKLETSDIQAFNLSSKLSGDLLTILAAIITIDNKAEKLISFLKSMESKRVASLEKSVELRQQHPEIDSLIWQHFYDPRNIAGVDAQDFLLMLRYLAIAQDGLENSTLSYLLRRYGVPSDENLEKVSLSLIDKLESFADNSKGMIVVSQADAPSEYIPNPDPDHNVYTMKTSRKVFHLDRNVARSFIEYSLNDPVQAINLRQDYLKFARLAREKSMHLKLTNPQHFVQSKYDYRYDIQSFYFLLNSLSPAELAEAGFDEISLAENQVFSLDANALAAPRFRYIMTRLINDELDRRGNLGRHLDQNQLKLDVYLRLFQFPPHPFPNWKTLKLDKIPIHWANSLKSEEMSHALLSIMRGAYFAGRYDLCRELDTGTKKSFKLIISRKDTSIDQKLTSARNYIRSKCYSVDARIRDSHDLFPAIRAAQKDLERTNNDIETLELTLNEANSTAIAEMRARIACIQLWLKRIDVSVRIKETRLNREKLVSLTPSYSTDFARSLGLRNRRILIAHHLFLLDNIKDMDVQSRCDHIHKLENLNSLNISLLDEIGGAERATVLIDTARITTKKAIHFYKSKNKEFEKELDIFCAELWKKAIEYVALTTDKINIPGTPLVYETALAWSSYSLYIELYNFYLRKYNSEILTANSAGNDKKVTFGLHDVISDTRFNLRLKEFGDILYDSTPWEKGEKNLYVKRYNWLMKQSNKLKTIEGYAPGKISKKFLNMAGC